MTGVGYVLDAGTASSVGEAAAGADIPDGKGFEVSLAEAT